MFAETPKVLPINGYQSKERDPVPERNTLRRLVHRLHRELADQGRELDVDRDADFVYFDIPLDLDSDGIDLCVHQGHVLIRMLRQDEDSVELAERTDPNHCFSRTDLPRSARKRPRNGNEG